LLICFFMVRSFIMQWRGPEYFPDTKVLFPIWPHEYRPLSWALLAATLVFLLAPKLLSLFYMCFWKKNHCQYGGRFCLFAGVVSETIISFFLAPLRMLSHAFAIIQIFLGKLIPWEIPDRNADISFKESVKGYGFTSLVSIAGIWAIFRYGQSVFLWLMVVMLPLALSVPACYFTGQSYAGRLFKKWRLFLIPEEIHTPDVVADINRFYKELEGAKARSRISRLDGFRQFVLDPYVNAVRRGFLGAKRHVSSVIAEDRKTMVQRALSKGPSALDENDKKSLLVDPGSLLNLHERVWELPRGQFMKEWLTPQERGEE